MGSAPGELVQHLDLFKALPRPVVAAVLAQARARNFQPGERVFAQGAPAHCFFLLVEGRLKLLQASGGGQQIIAHWVSAGQFFGLAVALGRPDYPGTAETVAPSTVLSWPSSSWAKVAAVHPAVAEAALRTVGGHAHEAFARLREVAAARAEQRIGRALLRLLREAGRRTDDGVLIDFPITRQEIAEMTSTTLYTVSRTLSAWERAGLLASGRRRLLIRDPQALLRLAGDT